MRGRDIFNGKTVLITGASSGIGRAFSFLFAQANVHLILTGRNTAKLESLKNEIESSYSVSCRIFPADLAVRQEVERMAREIDEAGLIVDVLVNNAGFVTYGYFHKLDIEKEMREISVNVGALVYLTHHFLSGMMRRGYGWILNVASTAALLPACPFEAVYGASKSFVSSFSLALNQEYHDKNIFVACLLPGNTDTDFWEHGILRKKYAGLRNHMADPIKVARCGFNMLVNRKNFFVFEKMTAAKAFFMRFLSSNLVGRIIYNKHYDERLEE